MTQIATIPNLNTDPTIRTSNITSRTHFLPRKFNRPHFLLLNHKICISNNNNIRRSHQQTTLHHMPTIAHSTTHRPLHVRSRNLVWIMRW